MQYFRQEVLPARTIWHYVKLSSRPAIKVTVFLFNAWMTILQQADLRVSACHTGKVVAN